jgi:iduronate 2-sulfatase
VPMRMPWKYFDLYRNKTNIWNKDSKYLKFPKNASIYGYKCCAETKFEYLLNDGSTKSRNIVSLKDFQKRHFTQSMYTELMWGYSAAVTYMDAQLGRLLDVIDELNIWDNLTVVLTSDHGMHNGEKGIW